MTSNQIKIKEFEKEKKGSEIKIKAKIQNKSEKGFYKFIQIKTGDHNLESKLLSLDPGQETKINEKYPEKEIKDNIKIIIKENNQEILNEPINNKSKKEKKQSNPKETGDKPKTTENKEKTVKKEKKQEENQVQEHKTSQLTKEKQEEASEKQRNLEKDETQDIEEKTSEKAQNKIKKAAEQRKEKMEKEKKSDKKKENETTENEEGKSNHSILDSIIHPLSSEPENEKEEQNEDQVEEKEEDKEEKEKEEEHKPEDNVERVTTGIKNLDPKVSGGFVKGTMNLVTGKTGTGKTAFCSNFIWRGAENGEPGVYVTTEERKEDILSDINAMFGWDFKEKEKQDTVRVKSIKPIFPSKDVDNLNRLVRSYISNLLNEVKESIDEIDAERVVIDSVSLVQMFIQDEYMARVALSSLLNSLREAGVTAVLVGSVPETSEGLSKEGIVEYLVDSVFLLEFVPVTEEHSRTLKIRKMRRTDHDTQIFPFEIKPDGIHVLEPYE